MTTGLLPRLGCRAGSLIPPLLALPSIHMPTSTRKKADSSDTCCGSQSATVAATHPQNDTSNHHRFLGRLSFAGFCVRLRTGKVFWVFLRVWREVVVNSATWTEVLVFLGSTAGVGVNLRSFWRGKDYPALASVEWLHFRRLSGFCAHCCPGRAGMGPTWRCGMHAPQPAMSQ